MKLSIVTSKKMMLALVTLLTASTVTMAKELTIKSPNGALALTVSDSAQILTYCINYNGKEMVMRSRLGLMSNIGDFSTKMNIADTATQQISESYDMRGTKCSHVNYHATQLDVNTINGEGKKMTVTFRIADNDVAFRYSFPQYANTACMNITGEATAFRLPNHTTTFICPQSDAMVGWMRTKPSYEEVYIADAPMDTVSQYRQGYTFPCLFHVGNDGWVLVNETGTAGNYVGCHLSDYDRNNGYTIAFPMQGEANGLGSTSAGIPLPGHTPWRTITVGDNLKPIVETTVAYDVVTPQYEPSAEYKPGRYTWSWIVWQDNSINYKDQVAFIDVAASMGYEYCLVDGCWDTNIGRDRIAELSSYAQSKGVSLLLWYNSNGYQNDAPQTPKQCMNTSVNRRREMAWMKEIGVKGIKVDFFGGDKQHTMQLYEDILSDANEYGLQVIFHGCTLPRGWERMYPNFVASEAVLASENVIFTEDFARSQSFNLTIHPFVRNAVASMDWGGTIMNRYMSRNNKSRHRRYTSDILEMASAITNQTSVQCIAMQPNNLTDIPDMEIEWLKTVPTACDETQFIDGYPGRYVVLARRYGERWVVAGINAMKEPKELKLSLPMFAGKTVTVYDDQPLKKGEIWPQGRKATKKVDKKGWLKVVIQPNGGLIIE